MTAQLLQLKESGRNAIKIKGVNSMDMIIRGRRIKFAKDDVIGRGGESVIYRDPDNPQSQAVKIYQEPNSFRSNKLKNFFSQRLNLPSSVISPLEPVTSD